ncbi:hypothetical protein [Spiroplasma clarkii]|uniref:Ribosome maturation factor RimP n=1 Tax=Spiroplasma clarkii TaxID=2139 RepID=A0A2K8KGQ2_9MOLU|nr:hypothetical protein [Spiroplasma clarkii]ATX70867.1 ribosome maturation factor RimP [Spiroplasma clarkii]
MSKAQIITKYQTQIQEILAQNHLQLFEINWIYEHETNVLQILAENSDSSVTNVEFDNLIAANEAISVLLDDDTDLTEPYVLEVASAGAERQVKNKEVLINNINKYFFLKTSTSYEGVSEFNATLNTYNPSTEEFTFSFFLKGKPKKAILKFTEIIFIRFAIKF